MYCFDLAERCSDLCDPLVPVVLAVEMGDHEQESRVYRFLYSLSHCLRCDCGTVDVLDRGLVGLGEL